MREMAVWAEQKEVMVLKELHDMQGRLMEMYNKLNKLIRCGEGNLEWELGMGSGRGSCVEQLKGSGKGQLSGPKGKAQVTGQSNGKEKVLGWGNGLQPKGMSVSQMGPSWRKKM